VAGEHTGFGGKMLKHVVMITIALMGFYDVAGHPTLPYGMLHGRISMMIMCRYLIDECNIGALANHTLTACCSVKPARQLEIAK
jgi:hypothetical protein